jgi:hypothetical protein
MRNIQARFSVRLLTLTIVIGSALLTLTTFVCEYRVE